MATQRGAWGPREMLQHLSVIDSHTLPAPNLVQGETPRSRPILLLSSLSSDRVRVYTSQCTPNPLHVAWQRFAQGRSEIGHCLVQTVTTGVTWGGYSAPAWGVFPVDRISAGLLCLVFYTPGACGKGGLLVWGYSGIMSSPIKPLAVRRGASAWSPCDQVLRDYYPLYPALACLPER